ncbi:MAG: Rrf2 family transcriptional regulator [Ruminococcus sp.]|nr:Rrf2 family transcriptional regulator [Ruminococcus sp.]
MKISTKGRYALRLMIDLAMHAEDGYIPIKAVAERQGISDKYLEQIISVLSRAGYVRSIRGAGGGYKLASSPDKYTVGMILRLTEGSLAPVACLEGDINPCERQDKCPTLFIWQKIYDAVNDVVDNITIADILEKELDGADNYVI